MFMFPWGDFHSLNLGWFLQKFNELRQDWATAEAGIDGALDAEIQKAEDALTDVFTARDAAAASATAAGQSATAAGNSATQAGNSASAAAGSASAAAGSATAAGQSETAAGNSATAASNSAGAAATSATQAGNSASAAQNSATAAGNSATAAAGSATAAGNSATAAAGSASAAGQSASDAETAAASVEAAAQQIATNTNDIVELKNAIGFVGSEAFPFLDLRHVKSQGLTGTLEAERIGNVLKIKGTRGAASIYFDVLNLKRITLQTYGAREDFIDSAETGMLFFTAKGTVTAQAIGGENTVGFELVEYTETPTALNSNRIGAFMFTASDFKDGLSGYVNIPQHTNPIRILCYARYETYDLEIVFKFINSKELASMQALILDN